MRHFDPDELPDPDLTAPQEPPPILREVSVTLKMSLKDGVSYSGTEEVNRLLAEGVRLREIKGPNMITTKIGEGDGMMTLTFTGAEVIFVFEAKPADWESHAQAVRDGDKTAIGEDMIARADWLKDEAKYQ